MHGQSNYLRMSREDSATKYTSGLAPELLSQRPRSSGAVPPDGPLQALVMRATLVAVAKGGDACRGAYGEGSSRDAEAPSFDPGTR